MRKNSVNTYCGRLTLRNDFHNTEATVLVRDGIIHTSSLQRARKKLCGMSDCACGDLRGPQDMIIDICYDYDGEYAKVYDK